MGLFDIFAEVVLAPVRIVESVAVTTLKTAVKTLAGDIEGAAEEIENGPDGIARAVDKSVQRIKEGTP